MVALQIIRARYFVPPLTLPRQHPEPGSRVGPLHWLERLLVLSHSCSTTPNEWQQTVWEHGLVAGVRAEKLSPPKGSTVREHSATQWHDTSVSCTLNTLPKRGSVPATTKCTSVNKLLINSLFKLCPASLSRIAPCTLHTLPKRGSVPATTKCTRKLLINSLFKLL